MRIQAPLNALIAGFLLLMFAGHINGQHSTTFFFPAPVPGYSVGNQIAGDGKGRILIAGTDRNTERRDNDVITDEYALWRYLPDGQPDHSFGKKGQVFRRIGDQPFEMNAMQVLPDGAWDTRFGEDGIVYVDMGNVNETELRLGRMLALPNRKILISGYEKTKPDGGHQFFLYQLLPDGRRDSSFGTFGAVRLPVDNDEFVPCLARDKNGNILVAGAHRVAEPGYKYALMLRRFLPDGQADTSFADQGTRIFEELPESYLLRDMVLTPQGRIILTGAVSNRNTSDVFLLEINPSLPIPKRLQECKLQIFNIGEQPYREQITGLLLLKQGEVLLYGCTGEKSTENYFLSLRKEDLMAEERFGDKGVYIQPWWNTGFYDKIQHAAFIGKRLYFTGAMPRQADTDPNCVLGIGIDWPLKLRYTSARF
jgi:uncharacterized delta-60 repeat protein